MWWMFIATWVYDIGCCLPFLLWLTLCLTSAWDQRSRLRNLLMTSLLVLALLDTGVLEPIWLSDGFMISCQKHITMLQLATTEDFISNWTLVLLLTVYLAQLQQFDPSSRMTSRKKILTLPLVASPWIIAAIMISVVYYKANFCSEIHWNMSGLILFIELSSRIVPLVLAFGMAGLAACIRSLKLRGLSGQTGDMEALAADNVGNVSFDPVLPYVLMSSSIFLEIPSFVMGFVYKDIDNKIYWILYVCVFVRMAKNFFLPLSFLAFPDVRAQVFGATRRLSHRVSGWCWCREPQRDTSVSYSNLRETSPDVVS